MIVKSKVLNVFDIEGLIALGTYPGFYGCTFYNNTNKEVILPVQKVLYSNCSFRGGPIKVPLNCDEVGCLTSLFWTFVNCGFDTASLVVSDANAINMSNYLYLLKELPSSMNIIITNIKEAEWLLEIREPRLVYWYDYTYLEVSGKHQVSMLSYYLEKFIKENPLMSLPEGRDYFCTKEEGPGGKATIRW